MPDWLFSCNTITFQKYFSCSRFSWLLLSYLLLILNYYLILFTFIQLPLPPIPLPLILKVHTNPPPSHIHDHSALPRSPSPPSSPFSPPSPLVFPPPPLAIALPMAPLTTGPTSHWKKTKKKTKLTFGERNWHKQEGGLGSNEIMAHINSAVSEGC